MATQILLDNTVLSNFALVGQTQLLHDSLGHRAATVTEVINEFNHGVLLRKVPGIDWQWLTFYTLAADELSLYQTLRRRLSAGEAACLAVAQTRKMAMMTDDRDARRVAIQYGIPLSGTLGILIQAVHKQIINLEQANRILHEMVSYGYRAPVAQLDSLL